ncbi:bifunctional DNA primase/polymerase [Lentilactobacillus hilgardii]|uniref:bifunctional DNA primase/polymerase n=1 Tax=Lentilactobacillus hilgardii TaxID=1588 RepID=UPI0021C3816A|nr:bifunctional DNA primase/polymerase [Lentilactobacillus hilgardii]MCP9334371.1 bifunctional DNA primase/polymerase [Lentilactobacillus hilgardii]MCP9350959.1 bifunctional DNA primase/polymerase [Lentilactobacillus hilgardii]MCP9353842.1 bifunctional DNA primase/polymerase [Lentilactobacillus hilgardii]
MNELTRHALELADQGLSVFPLQANSKRPITPHGYLDASHDVKQIEAWFNNGQHNNLGLRLADTGIVVVDIDHHTQVDGRQVLKEWQAKGMTLIPQYAEHTPHDGLHYFFKNQQPLSDKVIVPGIELKTKQIMIAPSQLDGKAYQTIKGTDLTRLSTLTAWLVNLLTSQQTAHTTLQHRLYKTWTGKLLDQLVAGTDQGQRNIYLTSLLGKLLHTGCDGDTAYSLLFFANDHLNPPLPDQEVNTIFKSLMKRMNQKRGATLGQ